MTGGHHHNWFLVSDEDAEVVAACDEILTLIEERSKYDKELRITDNKPDNYDKRDKPDGSGDWGQIQNFGQEQ